MDLCKKAIKQGKKAEKQIAYYNNFLDWLLKMIDVPYSKSCLNMLLKIEIKYNSELHKEVKSFLFIAIANNYLKLNQIDKAYCYLKKVIDNNHLLSIEVLSI